MTAKAILPSSKPSDAAAAFRDDGDNFHAGCDFQSNLAVDGSLDNFGHFSFQYVAGADFHEWAGLFQTGRGIAIELLHQSQTPHLQGHLSGASVDDASRN
jgi:hypothetical protein